MNQAAFRPSPLAGALCLVALVGCTVPPQAVHPPTVIDYRVFERAIVVTWGGEQRDEWDEVLVELRALVPSDQEERALEATWSSDEPKPLDASTESSSEVLVEEPVDASLGIWRSPELDPGLYSISLTAARHDLEGGRVQARLSGLPRELEIRPEGYRFISLKDLDLEEPFDVRVLYALHPAWNDHSPTQARNGVHWEEQEVDFPAFCRLFRSMTRNVLSEAFRECQSLELENADHDPWEKLEIARRTMIERGQVPGSLDPQALVTIDYRSRDSLRGISAQLCLRVFDLSALVYDYEHDPGPLRLQLRRALIFEDYVEVRRSGSERELSLHLMDGWRQILNNLSNSFRFAEFRSALEGVEARLTLEGKHAPLLGELAADFYENASDDLTGYHEEVERRVLFTAEPEVPARPGAVRKSEPADPESSKKPDTGTAPDKE